MLAFLSRRAFISSSREFLQRYWFQVSLGLIVIYALLDEFHQSFVPSRTPSIYDSAIDVAGGLAVLLVLKLFARKPHESEDNGHG
jgi:VanZ family protein